MSTFFPNGCVLNQDDIIQNLWVYNCGEKIEENSYILKELLIHWGTFPIPEHDKDVIKTSFGIKCNLRTGEYKIVCIFESCIKIPKYPCPQLVSFYYTLLCTPHWKHDLKLLHSLAIWYLLTGKYRDTFQCKWPSLVENKIFFISLGVINHRNWDRRCLIEQL